MIKCPCKTLQPNDRLAKSQTRCIIKGMILTVMPNGISFSVETLFWDKETCYNIQF